MQVALRYACEINANARTVQERLNYNERVSTNVHEPLRSSSSPLRSSRIKCGRTLLTECVAHEFLNRRHLATLDAGARAQHAVASKASYRFGTSVEDDQVMRAESMVVRVAVEGYGAPTEHPTACQTQTLTECVARTAIRRACWYTYAPARGVAQVGALLPLVQLSVPPRWRLRGVEKLQIRQAQRWRRFHTKVIHAC
jgi:hypothetical protein